jgi:hypothetical protein
MTPVRKAIDLILHQHEPYPAFVVDRYWNLLLTNQGATRLLDRFIVGGASPLENPERLQTLLYRDGKINILRVRPDRFSATRQADFATPAATSVAD